MKEDNVCKAFFRVLLLLFVLFKYYFVSLYVFSHKIFMCDILLF